MLWNTFCLILKSIQACGSIFFLRIFLLHKQWSVESAFKRSCTWPAPVTNWAVLYLDLRCGISTPIPILLLICLNSFSLSIRPTHGGKRYHNFASKNDKYLFIASSISESHWCLAPKSHTSDPNSIDFRLSKHNS